MLGDLWRKAMLYPSQTRRERTVWKHRSVVLLFLLPVSLLACLFSTLPYFLLFFIFILTSLKYYMTILLHIKLLCWKFCSLMSSSVLVSGRCSRSGPWEWSHRARGWGLTTCLGLYSNTGLCFLEGCVYPRELELTHTHSFIFVRAPSHLSAELLVVFLFSLCTKTHTFTVHVPLSVLLLITGPV